MGLFDTLFNRGASDSHSREGRPSGAADSELAKTPQGRNQLRRELVQVVVRETMRTHGIPADWLTAMVLPLSGTASRRGVHVLLVVRQGHEEMLAYVPAFQRSFFAGLRQFEPRALEWMLGLSWQFEGMPDSVGAAALPPLRTAGVGAGAAGAALDEERAAAAGEDRFTSDDEDLQEDLRALLAIRDEALQAHDSGPPESDFQPTQPLQ